MKKKLNDLDKYVIFSISMLLIYTVVEMIVSSIINMEHSALTEKFFLCFGGEILSCCLIKIFKLKRSNNDVGL